MISRRIAVRFWIPLLSCGIAAASAFASPWPITDGPVNRVVLSGNRLYLGGRFQTVGRPARNGATLSVANGTVLANLDLDGVVNTLAPDGAGGWFLGGYFASAQGNPRSNLAHVAADGSVTAWSPVADRYVNSMVVVGSTVYVGGKFDQINGQYRSRIAAIDANTGELLPWNPVSDNDVAALAVSGNILYAGGTFTTMGGQTRNRIAAMDRNTGAVTAWNPNADQDVGFLTVDGSSVYASGMFNVIGSASRYRVAQLDASTGSATSWDAQATSGGISSIAVSGTNVYLAEGSRRSEGKHARGPRRSIAPRAPSVRGTRIHGGSADILT